ncbi:MAG TPA: hypothetical protein VF153_01075 [Candidatus Limnocylindria bacterium]
MTILLVCLMVAMAGCARLGAGGAAGEGSASPVPTDGKPDDPAIGSPDPAPPTDDPHVTHEQPDPTVFDPQSAAVDHFTIGPDGRTVVVFWWGGNRECFGMKAVQVDVPDGTPIVTVLEGWREAARGKACTMEAVLKSAVVVLDEPIVADAANPDPDAGEAMIFEGTTQVEPVPGVKEPRPHAVSGYALSPDGLKLSIYYVGGLEQCYALASASAFREGAVASLTVSIREGWIAADDVACDDIGVPKVVKLRLGEPLMVSGTVES